MRSCRESLALGAGKTAAPPTEDRLGKLASKGRFADPRWSKEGKTRWDSLLFEESSELGRYPTVTDNVEARSVHTLILLQAFDSQLVEVS